MDLESFVSKHLELLELEKEAEVEENRCLQDNASTIDLQQKGVCIPKLRLGSCCTGLYGRTICTFETFWPGKPFPSHSISSGDIVGVAQHDGNGRRNILVSGVVTRVNQSAVSVAFEENFDLLGLEDDTAYLLVKLANEVTYKRIKRALTKLNKYHGGRASNLIAVLFGERISDPLRCIDCDGEPLRFFNSNLDFSQQEAVRFSLCQKEISIVHGPPGTGKTTTVVEIIMQTVKQGLKVLACAPSNIAVDNLVERLAALKVRVIRLGHPARLLSGLQHYSLDSVITRSDEGKIVEDLRKEIDSIKAKAMKSKDKGERHRLWGESKLLCREMKDREKTALKEILRKADVILSTLTSASDDGPLKHLPPEHFGLVVIDECSQALEAACWIPLPLAPKCVLSGDHLQLPPTIVSNKAAKDGLAVTLMERLSLLHGELIKKMLCIQYRMHQDIMKWPSDQLYNGKLVAHPSVATYLLRDLVGVSENEDTTTPLLLIDTAGCDLQELNLSSEESKANEGEADLVAVHVTHLIVSGVRPRDIAVITPYNLQVDLLRLRLSPKYPALEIKSVDGFQGREKEAVVLSLVRSNNRGEVGFLSEDRRINVAITRAKRHLAVICDSETVSHHPFLKSLVEYLLTVGEVQSAEQYQGEMNKFDVSRPKNLQVNMSLTTSALKAKSKKNVSKEENGKKKQENNTRNSNNLKQPVMKEKDEPKELDSHYTRNWEASAKEQIQSIIEDFLQDNTKEIHTFPLSLTANERRIVHEVAEKMGLLHISHGEGDERHIVVQKRSENQLSESVVNKHTEEKAKESKPNEVMQNTHQDSCAEQLANNCDLSSATSQTFTKCSLCQKNIPEGNYELHILHCERKQNTNSKENKVDKQTKMKSMPQDKHTKLKSLPEENFDALLAEAVKNDMTCTFHKCKTSLATLSQTCQFCYKRFCFSHFIPEVHGCGELARAHARRQIKKEGKLYSGSGVPEKHLDPTKKAHLQRKLGKKLSEMTDKRKAKKK